MATSSSARAAKDWLLDPEAFRKRLAAEPPHALYVLAGPERFLAGELLDAIRARVLGHTDGQRGWVVIDGPRRKSDVASFDVRDALDELRSGSLFAERKVVVILDADFLLVEHAALFLEYLARPMPTSSLVLVLDGLDGRTKIARALPATDCLPAACRTLYDRPAPWERGRVPPHSSELSRWVADRARRVHGVAIDLVVAHQVTQVLGRDLGPLADALARLALLVGERKTITADDVRALLAPASGASAFALAEALADRQAAAALGICRRIWLHGLDLGDGKLERDPARGGIVLLASLRRALWRFLRARDAAGPRGDLGAALAEAGVNRVFLDAAVTQLAAWPADDLRAALADLADLEERSKTGRVASFAAELELFLVRHTAAAPSIRMEATPRGASRRFD